MIQCCSDKYPVQWFHCECIGITPNDVADNWWCTQPPLSGPGTLVNHEIKTPLRKDLGDFLEVEFIEQDIVPIVVERDAVSSM